MEVKKGKKAVYVLALVAIIVLLGNMFFVSAITGSMGNARMILYPEVNGWTNTVIEKSINVKNVNNASINITLVADENSTEFIDIIDESFILQPGEEKKAKFEIKVKKEGTYEGRINVFFKPVEGKESGVVLSSTIIVIASKEGAYEEEVEEEVIEEEENSEIITGNIVNDKKGLSTTGKFLISSAVLLIIVLLLLSYLGSKKRGKNKHLKKRQ